MFQQGPEFLLTNTHQGIPLHPRLFGGAGSPVTSLYPAAGTRASQQQGCRIKNAPFLGGQAHSAQEGFHSLLTQGATPRGPPVECGVLEAEARGSLPQL